MLYFDFINPYFVYSVYVLFTAFSIFAIFTKKDWFNKNRNTIFIIVAILLTWTQFARYAGVFFEEDQTFHFWIFDFRIIAFDITTHLPFYMCRISVVVFLYYAYTKDKKMHSFLFYWGALGLAGVLYPNGPISNVENLTETFFIDHYLLTIIPFYLVSIEGYKPIRKDMFFIAGLMAFILFLFIPINSWMNADYFYLTDQSIFAQVVPNASKALFILFHTLTALVFFNFYYMWFGKKQESIKKVS